MASSDVNSAYAPPGQHGGDIEMAQPNNAPAPQTDLFSENRELAVGLYKAALNGDWEKAEGLLKAEGLFRNDSPDRETLLAKITMEHDTALHVAAGARQTKFVEKLIGFMEPKDLKLPDKNGNTAFCLAAAAGAKSIAEIMIKEKPNLPEVRGSEGATPLCLAAMYGQEDMVRYLHPKTIEILETNDQTELLFFYIDIGLFDLALDLVKEDPSKKEDSKLADDITKNKKIAVPDCVEALCKLARKPSAFASKNPGIWKTLIKSYFMPKEIYSSCAHGDHDVSHGPTTTPPSLPRDTVPSGPIIEPQHLSSQLGPNLQSIEASAATQQPCENMCPASNISLDTTSRHRRELNQTDDALELVRLLWKKVSHEREDRDILQIIKNHPALLFEAAELGNFKFLAELICSYPRLIWEKNEKGQTIFHIAVLHRHVNIFSQIHKVGSIKDIIAEYTDGSENNILHLAALLPDPSRLNVVPGAALQMQRELIWFQEVEKIVQPSSRQKKNSKGLTPRALFTKRHTNLLKEGEKWMKDRAHFCMLVATLITTVVFAAAFSVPGGNNDIEGTPNHLEENWFQVFAVSDAIAFSFSLFSTLVFLSILTSRYTEKAFLKLLPYKLMAGLLTLFISMIAMMAAFTAAFIVAYNHKKWWVPMLTSAMAFLPAAVFVSLQYSLFFDIFKSTFLSRSLFRPSKPMIC